MAPAPTGASLTTPVVTPLLQATPAPPDLCLSRLHHRAVLCSRGLSHRAGPTLVSVGKSQRAVSHHRCDEAQGLDWTVRHTSLSWPPAAGITGGCRGCRTRLPRHSYNSLKCCRTCMHGRCPSGSPAAAMVCLSYLQPICTGGLALATPAASLPDLLAASAPVQALCRLQGAGRHA